MGPATKANRPGVVRNSTRRTYKLSCRTSMSLFDLSKLLPIKIRKTPWGRINKAKTRFHCLGGAQTLKQVEHAPTQPWPIPGRHTPPVLGSRGQSGPQRFLPAGHLLIQGKARRIRRQPLQHLSTKCNPTSPSLYAEADILPETRLQGGLLRKTAFAALRMGRIERSSNVQFTFVQI